MKEEGDGEWDGRVEGDEVMSRVRERVGAVLEAGAELGSSGLGNRQE